MPRFRWLAAVLLLSLAARPAAAQAPLAWRWQEKDQFYVEWAAHIKTAHKTTREEKWPLPVEERTRVVFRATVLKCQPDGGMELELVLESTEADTLPGRLSPKLMEGLPVRASLGPQMQILRLQGLEAAVQKRYGEGALPPQASTFRALIEDVWREWLQSVFFPVSGNAAAGARWEQETEKALPPLGRHLLRKTFVREGKAAGNGRELARLTVTGASTLVPYKEGDLDTPHKVTGAHFNKAEYRGTFLFDPVRGRLAQGQAELHTHLSAALDVDGSASEREATQDQVIEVHVLDQKPAAAVAAAPPPVSTDAPCRRLLTGEHARRAADWEKRIADLTEAGLWGEALTLARQAADLRTRLQGAAHWQATDAVRNVQTLEKLVALPEADRAEFLALPRLLAQSAELRARGKHAEAAALAEKAWAVRCRILGAEHDSTPRLFEELAASFSAHGKHAEAQVLSEKALELCRRVLGEEHPDTARAYNNLGCRLLAQNNARAAEPLLRQGLAIRLRVLGEDSAETARAYDNLGVCLNNQDRFAEAQPFHEKAVAISRRALGEDAADAVQCGYNLAINLLMLNRPAEAEPLLRRSLDFHLRSVGEQHLATAVTYSNLAASLMRQSRSPEAEPLLRRSLDVHRRVLGETNIETLRTCAQLGQLLRSLGKDQEGQELLRWAEEQLRRAQGGS
jgi:tetratricopeptide (TPR) repeat protein